MRPSKSSKLTLGFPSKSERYCAKSVDLNVASDISSSLQQVSDQNNNNSALYVSSGTVGINTSSAPTSSGLAVYAQGGDDAIATVRPSTSGTRTHLQAYSQASDGTNTSVFSLMVVDDTTFCINVNGTDRLIIDKDGNMTLKVASLTIDGLNLPGEGHNSDLTIDSTGKVGVQ